MIDVTSEELITLDEAARLLPKINGRVIHLSAVWRWCMKGVGPEHVKLGHVRIGRQVCTTEEALHRFMHASAAAAVARLDRQAVPLPPKPLKIRTRTGKQRAIDIARAEAILKAAGI